MRCCCAGLIVLSATLTFPVALGAQNQHVGAVYGPERITGRVTTDSAVAIAGAEVIVTRGPDRAVQRDTTGADGLFSILWHEGTGDYLVYVTATGRATFRRRIQRASDADSVHVVDVQLAPLVTRLSPVAVVASRPRPRRDAAPSARTPGAADWSADDYLRLLPPDDLGDLAAMAAAVPGMIMGPDGTSALGLDAAQNQTTLDGLAFAGADIPREAGVSTRVASSVYDPTRGGFSGAQIALDFWTGGLFTRSNGSMSFDAPVLQLSDAAGRQLGQQFTNVRMSMGADGPWGRTDAYRYNVSGQFSRRTAAAVSLLDAPADALLVAGVSPDSAAALASVLGQLGIPRGADARTRATEQVTVLGRFDRTGFDWNAREDRPRSGAVTAYARLRRSNDLGLGPTSVGTHGGRSEGRTLALQGLYSVFAGEHRDRLIEFRSTYSIQRDDSEPALAYPAGQVLVGADASTLAPGAFTALRFGGNPWLAARREQWTWETRGEAQWYSTAKHRIKLMAQSRFDGVTADPAANRLGSYTFNSLADLAAGRAASYSRTIAAPTRSGGVWNGALAAGDFWRPHERVELVYGGRLEASSFTTTPVANQDVERLFGTRTDFAPARVRLSPRLGFTWNYSRRSAAASAGSFSALGVSAVRPAGVLRGGIGEFRSLFSPSLIGDAMAMTGLPGGAARLLCIGDAVPPPEWHEFNSGTGAFPAACRLGAVNLADTAPPVMLFARDFDVPRSWRANLAWTTRWRSVSVNVDGIVSLNWNQPGTMDLNLIPEPAGSLASEGDRPLYVPLSAIVPHTGAIVPVLARRHASYGRVTSLQGDLRSTSRQLVISLQPDFETTTRLSVAYALGSVRSEKRGFDGAAFGDPNVREMARGDLDIRHQFVVSGGQSVGWLGGTTFTIYGVLQSGYPYTPLVAGDVNGDGFSNDRAFVHAPGVARAAGDTALASGMEALLAGAPAHARRCLERQIGRPAGRNSCEGPWTATMNARIDLPWRFVGTGIPDRHRVRVGINLANPLAGLDQLFHGSGNLRGWGVRRIPTQTLYTVAGFDPVTQRFLYHVNPRFGRTDPFSSMLRAPFRATLDVSIDLGRPPEVQQVDRFLAPGRSRPGSKLDSAALHARYSRNVPNVYALVLRQADSLLLTRPQIEALEREERAYLLRMNALWGRMAAEFARLPERFDATEALRRQEDYVDQAWEINRNGALTIRDVLTPLQFPLTSGTVQYLATETGRIRIRIFR